MLKVTQEALTFDDVLLVPNQSNVLPSDASLKTFLTSKIQLNIPLISAAMDTVTESDLAISIAQEGGIGIIHKNLTAQQQADEVMKVKKFESGVITDPVVTSPECSIKEVIELTAKHKISGVPVVKGKNLVGIVTARDLRFVKKVNPQVSTIMTPKERLVTVQEGASKEKVKKLFHENRIEKILVINSKFQLKGMITVKDMQKSKDFPNACKDGFQRLRVGAAIGGPIGAAIGATVGGIDGGLKGALTGGATGYFGGRALRGGVEGAGFNLPGTGINTPPSGLTFGERFKGAVTGGLKGLMGESSNLSDTYKSNYFEIIVEADYLNILNFMKAIQEYDAFVLPYCFVPRIASNETSMEFNQIQNISGQVKAKIILNIPTN